MAKFYKRLLNIADLIDKEDKKEARDKKIMEDVMAFDKPKEKEADKPKSGSWGKKPEDEEK